MASSEPKSNIDDCITEFNGIAEKLENGRDVCDLMTGFWEKLAKIEQSYAKQLVDLCQGRYARLETLLGQTKMFLARNNAEEKTPQPASLEHIVSLQDCWVKVVGEVQHLAAEHETLAGHVTTKVAPTITKFVKDKLKEEMAKAATGKRLLNDAKTGYQKVTATKRKYFSDVASGKAGADEDSEPPSKMAYHNAVNDLGARYDDIFLVGLPGVLKDVNVIEQDRAQMLCSCMNQYTQSAAALKQALTFDATAAALEATTKDQSVTQLVLETPAPPKPEIEEATEENIEKEQTEAQTGSLITAMSGWLSNIRTPSAGTVDEAADTTAVASPSAADKETKAPTPTATEGQTTSRLSSLFSGWGRKKTTPAEEPKVDAPGLLDSTDGADDEASGEQADASTQPQPTPKDPVDDEDQEQAMDEGVSDGKTEEKENDDDGL